MALFDGLAEDQEKDEGKLWDRYGSCYTEAKYAEKNRERHEYRSCQSCSDAERLKAIQEERPHIACVGRASQVRILMVQDGRGSDITPSLTEFLKNRSRKQPKPVDGSCIILKNDCIIPHNMLKYPKEVHIQGD